MAVVACKDENDPSTNNPQFSIEEQYLKQDFEQKSSFVTIPVNTNIDKKDWKVTSDQSWCLVDSRQSSTSEIIISVNSNEEPEIREASVSVNSPVQNYTISIRQLGYGPAILIKDATPIIKADGGTLDVSVTSNIEYKVTNPDCEWIYESSKSRALTEKSYRYTVDSNNTYEKRTANIIYTGTEYSEVSAVCNVTQEEKESGLGDVVIESDIKFSPSRGEASEAQPGYGIEYSFDGKFDPLGKHYHSLWGENTKFPVVLEYFFDDKPDLDYIIYHPRKGNGNFGKLDISIATENNPEYSEIGSYDFKGQNAPSKVNFANTIEKVTKVKFTVKSGLGNYASCDEMEFYKINSEKSLDKQLLSVFKDITCTELKENVTDEVINSLPGYFVKLALMLKNNTYDEWEKEFRIQTYEPYSNVEEWAEKLMTKRYSNLDNPTGICVEPGDSVVVLVGETNGKQLSLQCIGEESAGDYVQTAASGETYFLQEGVNKLGFNQTGMLFVMYTATPHDEPVKIHIAPGSGKVQGFFDLKRHKTNEKYTELINKSTYKYFCVRGERIMFYFHREDMKRAVPSDILSAINLWDDIIKWQQELMGIEDVRPSEVNNHLFAISPEGNYMWASDYRIGFVNTHLENILLKENVMAAKDNAWGPAHEIGHIHQKAINWPGSTESSNNLFSNYILYKLGKYCSRGEELDALANARFVNNQVWYNMGSSTHQNEDTELHMRMNWQLWNYYHRCGHNPGFWQKLFQLLREDRIVENNPGEGQLKFAVNACKAANENLTDFFEMWGFLEPVDNKRIEQYGNYTYNVTQEMIDNAKREMDKYPAAKHAFYYLEDRKNNDVGIENYKVGDVGYYTQFEGEGQEITKEVKYRLSGNNVEIVDGEEAVAFEIRKDDKILYFSNFFKFAVPSTINISGAEVYAVQADGKRIKAIKQ